MQPLLIDEGLPAFVATALAALGLTANAVGHPGAPPKGSGDDANCEWCKQNSDAVLVTNDRGKTDNVILDLLAQHRVHAIFVYNDLRNAPAHHLARALLRSENQMDDLVARDKLIRRGLRPGGGLTKL